MADLHVRSKEELKDQAEPFDGNNSYQKVIRFGDEKLKAELTEQIDFIRNRNEKVRLNNIYNHALQEMDIALTEEQCRQVAESFESISGFKDADALAQQCLEKAETARKDSVYEKIQQLSRSIESLGLSRLNIISNLERLCSLCESIPGWKNADELSANYRHRLEALKKEVEDKRLEQEYYAKVQRLEMERRAEQERIASKKHKKKTQMMVWIVACILVLIFIFVLVTMLNG